ncbi:MAG: hypothetical protein SAK29_30715 [Scytonema sp. PMC 1069.18]|nr:hypothetical protein [Scytonema sp. PMC 1069.18]MEC4887255.1 hypothetical protein [Scytonema sp. PMC 1070.18]
MSFADPIPNEPTKIEVIPPTQPESETELLQTDAQEQANNVEDSGAIFQAVGVIIGSVKFSDENKSTVTIGRKEYQLFYAPRKQRAYEALKKEIEATGEHTQRLVVYPKAIHFPRKDQPHRIAFQLVGFDRGREEEAVSGELQDLEFKLSGLWQFIPVCPTPCISVFRNFSRERLEYIKQAEPAKKVKFMKASHLPVLWKDAPVRPFRFNPKAGKDQGHPAFVEIKAKFLPHRDVFGFAELLGEPRDTAPKFLKASKKDKATVQNANKPRKQEDGAPSKRDTDKPRKKINPVVKNREDSELKQ